MKKKLTIQDIVVKKFPGAQVERTADTNTGRYIAGYSRSATAISDLKKRLGMVKVAGLSDAKKSPTPRRAAGRVAAKEGPSGVVTVIPRTADGVRAGRRYAKTVIVSKGKVVALQG